MKTLALKGLLAVRDSFSVDTSVTATKFSFQKFASQIVSGICQAKSKENLNEYSWMLEIITGVHRREQEDELSFFFFLGKS